MIAWPYERATWLNEPAEWSWDGHLVAHSQANTDFWRITHYGFIRDNGHHFAVPTTGDMVMRATVTGEYADQYDQAGLMLRVSDHQWCKAGIEYVDGVHHLSAVVTSETSDWSSWPLAKAPGTLGVEIARSGDAVSISFSVHDGPWTLFRMFGLDPDTRVTVGPFLAAPDGAGVRARFTDLLWSEGARD